MRVRAESVPSEKKKTKVLCTFCFEDTNAPIGLGRFNKKIDQIVSQSVKEIKGKRNKITIIHSHKRFQQREFWLQG